MNIKTVGECFPYIKNGANIKQGRGKGGYPITRIETLSQSVFNRDRMGFADITNLAPYADRVLEDGDILMSHINSIPYLGRSVMYESQPGERIIHGMNLLRLKADRTVIDPGYAVIYFNSPYFKTQLMTIVKKAVNQASYSIGDLKKLAIPCPSLAEQTEVIKRFQALNDSQHKLKQMDDAFDRLVKSRFVEMFGDPDNNSPCCPIEQLSEHLQVVGGFAFKSNQFQTSGIPILRIGNINTGVFIPRNMVFWKNDPAIERYKVYPGDLLMSLTGTVGKDDYGNVCVLGDDYPEYYLNQRNAKLELDGSLNSRFLSEYLKFPCVKKRLTGISRGVRQANISNRDILGLAVPMPPLSLQQEFEAFVAQVDKSRFAVQQAIEQLETLKASLMQKYFG